MLVKVCGITNLENLKAILAGSGDGDDLLTLLGTARRAPTDPLILDGNAQRSVGARRAVLNNALCPHYLGFISYKESPRYVSPENMIPLVAIVPDEINKVLVSVDQELPELEKYLDSIRIEVLQLHGEEDLGYVRQIKKVYPELKIIKAINIAASEDFNNLGEFADQVDFFLFDTKSEVRGGSGVKFPWELLKNYNCETPYFLSGGITLDDLAQIKIVADQDRRLIGIDVNSGFEISKGIKDSKKVLKLLSQIGEL